MVMPSVHFLWCPCSSLIFQSSLFASDWLCPLYRRYCQYSQVVPFISGLSSNVNLCPSQQVSIISCYDDSMISILSVSAFCLKKHLSKRIFCSRMESTSSPGCVQCPEVRIIICFCLIFLYVLRVV